MSADNQGGPASPPDRREFLKAAAAVSAALTATQMLGADGTLKPVTGTLMPHIALGKYSVSRLIVGCHDIDGGGHVSPLLQRETREYYTPERAVNQPHGFHNQGAQG
jgi:hypothetical protein